MHAWTTPLAAVTLPPARAVAAGRESEDIVGSVVLIGGQSPEEVEMNMPSDAAPKQPDDAHVDADDAPAAATPAAPVLPTPVPLTQSREDTDVGWGEYRERDDDDRLVRDRPPHWDNA
jgi:hypothetical protein